MATPQIPTPVEIGRANQHDVKIRWNDGREIIYPARRLRLACPCAACVEEMTGRRMLVESAVPAEVHPLSIHAVGRYAIQILWSDGHQTGIYTWERLYEMAGQLPNSKIER
ncbi:MAG: DUF971 domain-containing protein [candidate division Zixibacteria bacterium]|nr:DUF971 domain-containing protein [candidate division Zixibacteria bacterium]